MKLKFDKEKEDLYAVYAIRKDGAKEFICHLDAEDMEVKDHGNFLKTYIFRMRGRMVATFSTIEEATR